MVKAVEKAKVPNMVWYNYRRVPAVMLAKQLIDEGKLGGDLRVMGGNSGEYLPPEAVHIGEDVGLVNGGQSLLSSLCQIKSVGYHPLGTFSGYHSNLVGKFFGIRLDIEVEPGMVELALHRQGLFLGPVEPGTDTDIKVLGVLPDHQEIDIGRPLPGKWCRDTGKKPYRPQVDELVEVKPDTEEYPFLEYPGSDPLVPDGTEVDGTVAGEIF